MDQLFPGGAYMDDLPHVCTLCGMLFNNAMTLQHHMQLHILSANAQMSDQGLGINPAVNILDLISGVTQHVVSSNNPPLIPAQALFTSSAASMPSHLISSSLGLPLSQPPVSKVKQKKSKSSKSSTNSSIGSTISVSSTPRYVSSFKSSRESSTYISTFPKDIEQFDLSPQSKTTQPPMAKDNDGENFLSSSSSQFDTIEEALKIPTFSKSSSFNRQTSNSSMYSSHDFSTKDSKLFQPFVTSEEQIGMPYMSKSNSMFTADSLISPMKVLSDKQPLDFDILSTPQKSHGSSESLHSSPQSLCQTTVSGDMRLGRMKTQLSLDSPQHFDKLKDIPTQITPPNMGDNYSMKSQFYPGLMDPLTISPKTTQVFRDNKDIDSLSKMPSQSSHFSGSKSSSPELDLRISVSKELFGNSKDSIGSLVSPKMPMDLKTSTIDSTTATVPPKSQLFVGSDEASTKGSVSAAIPQVFGNTPGSSAGVMPGVINPPLGLSDPLASFSNGTGYFNALTQKLINPGLNIGADFNKPSTSALNFGSELGQKGKSYFENGILINQDYDKISDTNEDDDLERLIDDIDTKDDHIDTKGYSEIEDLLNEFNEHNPEDSKNRSQMDEFLNDVLNENSKLRADNNKVDRNTLPEEDMDVTKSVITEILEKEKEIIDKESKMLESARLKASELSVDEEEPPMYSKTSTSTTAASATVSKDSSKGSLEEISKTDKDSSKSCHKKEDDPIDEIPKVGKLMKIRKYFQIQEQKKKEQTQSTGKDAVAEIKIKEKEPVVEVKPQTILVQVSKRKKIEYGPYINRQSLLEGKPKTNDTEKSPPKVFRPKPKPQVPVKSTFNLRARTTKTDFASLANKGSRTPEVKKTEEKSNSAEKNKVVKEDEDKKDVDKTETETEKANDLESKEESKVIASHKDKLKKDIETPVKDSSKNDKVKKDLENPVKDSSKHDKLKNDVENPVKDSSKNDKVKKDLENPVKDSSKKDKVKKDLENPVKDSGKKDKVKKDVENTVNDSGKKDKVKKDVENTMNDSSKKDKVKKDVEPPVNNSGKKDKVKKDVEPPVNNSGKKDKVKKDIENPVKDSNKKEKVKKDVENPVNDSGKKDKVKKDSENNANDTSKTKMNKPKNEAEPSVQTETDLEKDTREEIKLNLRTRSVKVEIGDNDSKNLRKRVIKSPAHCSKAKIVKTEEKLPETDKEAEEKIARKGLRNKQKTTPEKSDIKMCSVNLGENLTEFKIKAANQIKVSPKSAIVKSKESKEKEQPSENKTSKDKDKDLNTEEKERNIFIDLVASEDNVIKETEVEPKDSSVQKNITKPEVEQKQSSAQKKKSKSALDSKDISVKNKIIIHINNTAEGNSVIRSDKNIKEPETVSETPIKENEIEIIKTKEDSKIQFVETKMDESKAEFTEYKTKSGKNDTDVKNDNNLAKPEKRLTLKLKLGFDVKKSLRESRLKSEKNKLASQKKRNSAAKSECNSDELNKKIQDSIEATRKNIEKYRFETLNEKIQAKSIKHVDQNLSEAHAEATNETSTKGDVQFFEKTIIDSFEIESADIDIVEAENEIRAKYIGDLEKKKTGTDDTTMNEQSLKDSVETKTTKKVKHSVENEFQRLVDEAMAEVKKAHEKGESEKPERYVNLRKRLNEAIKYNVDDSDDDNEMKHFLYHDRAFNVATPKKVAKLSETPSKLGPKNVPKVKKDQQVVKPVKKDLDVYDFTDTELSDTEETPSKLSFKPNSVSINVKMFGMNKIPFVSNPMPTSPTAKKTDTEVDKPVSEGEESAEIAYIGKTVEPLKIKLTKIVPYKEKKHKHKKKKKKKDRDKKHREQTAGAEVSDSDQKISENEIEMIPENMTEDMDIDSVEMQPEDFENTVAKGNLAKKQSKLKEKKHICTFCNQGFGQKCDLRKHLMIHTGERPWPCEICDKKFQRKTDLVKHTRTHTGEKPYACEFCDKRVSDKSQLNVHRRLHTGDRPYQCTKCGRGCITSSELTRHRAICTEKTNDCVLCKKIFKHKECLGLHMKMHYKSRGKLFKCDKCSLGFDRRLDLEIHKCDNSPTLYICSECYAEFTDEVGYARHLKTHDLNVFLCNMCTNIFEDKQSLETHFCSLGEDKQKQLQCDICDLTFIDQESLAQHVLVHDEDMGSFMCDLCPEIFSTRKDFIGHCRNHEEENELICENCGELFNETSAKITHENNCHVNLKSELKSSSDGDCDVLKYEFSDDVLSADASKQDRSSKGANSKPGNETRASVISGNFRNTENSSLKEQKQESKSTVSKSDFQNVGACVKNKVNKRPVVFSDTKSDIFESSEFSNSPDFSSLTDDSNLNTNAFHKVPANNRPFTEASNFRGKNVDPNQANSEKINTNLERTLNRQNHDMDNKRQSQNVTTTHLQGSSYSAQNPQDFRWSGSYQISATDYVNSLLNKMGSSDNSVSGGSNRSFAIKTENIQSDTPKSLNLLATNRTSDSFKDNIENHSKPDIFSDFDFPLSSQKVDLFPNSMQGKGSLQSKYSGANINELSAFQGVEPNLYNVNLSRSRQHFQEKTEFLPYSNSFLSTFPQSSQFNSNSNNNLFGSSSHDITKRASSSSIFPGNQDMLQNNFFLNGEESIKGASPTDKTDETTALLSNFDYGMN